MEPVAKRINERHGRRRNTYFMIGKCSNFQAKNSHSSHNFLKDISAGTSSSGQNEYNQYSAPIGAMMTGGIEVESVCRGNVVGVRTAKDTWKGITPIAGIKERKIKGTYHPNFYLNTNPSVNVHMGMLSRAHIPTLHPLNVNRISPPNYNRNMFHVTAEMEQRRSSDQNIRIHPEGGVPIFYEPLKYPPFKMADRLKKEKAEEIDRSTENYENMDIMKKEKEYNEGNDHLGVMKTQNKEMGEDVTKMIEEGKKTIQDTSKCLEEVRKHDELNRKPIQRNGEETNEKKKQKWEVSKYRKELKYNEKISETDEPDEGDEDDVYAKRTPCSGGETNEDTNTYSNRDDEEIKEFLTLSLNPSNITIKPETITNEIKFILHMTLLTLYKDQIKPTYRKIKRRLKCFSENFEIKYNFLNIYALLQNQYIVVRSKNNNVFVLLRETPKWFLGWVNTKSFSNIYPKNVWKYFITYLLDISREKWEYAYSSFLLKFINYLKQNQLLFYVQSSKRDSNSCNENSVKEALNFEELIGECENSNINPENKIYRYIDEKKNFSFFSYLDTFYNEKREKAFCGSYISILKKEENLSKIEERVLGETNDDVTLQKTVSFSEKWKQDDTSNNCNNNNDDISYNNNNNKKKNNNSNNNDNNNSNNNNNNNNNNENEKLQIEKERKQEEQTDFTRRCFEKYKTIFSSKENGLSNERNADGKKHKWEFDSDIYEMANFLKKQNFIFFKNYSLGKIAHIIQLSLYSGLLIEEGGCIKPACSVKTVIPSVFYFKDLQGANEEKTDLTEQQQKKMNNKKTEGKEMKTGVLEIEKEEVQKFAGYIQSSITSTFVQENAFHEKQEHSFEKDDLYYGDSYLDQNFSFGFSEYSKFEEPKLELELELKLGEDETHVINGDVFEQMLRDVREARTSSEYPNLETKKRELFHWEYLYAQKDDICEREVSCGVKEPNLLKANLKNDFFLETSNSTIRNEENQNWNNGSEHRRNDELMENVKLIRNLEEAKVKIERLLKRSYKKQMFLYLFREKFYKKYKEVINPLYFGYNSLIEFLFFACKEVCKLYILNKHIVLMHPNCNINYLQNKKENIIQPFSYLDYFYSAPEKKKESENRKEKKNKNEQTAKIENPSLEICSIMKDLAKKKNNLFITFHFWKKWNTTNKNILNEVHFFKSDENREANEFQVQNKCKYYNLFKPKREEDVFDLSELLKK